MPTIREDGGIKFRFDFRLLIGFLGLTASLAHTIVNINLRDREYNLCEHVCCTLEHNDPTRTYCLIAYTPPLKEPIPASAEPILENMFSVHDLPRLRDSHKSQKKLLGKFGWAAHDLGIKILAISMPRSAHLHPSFVRSTSVVHGLWNIDPYWNCFSLIPYLPTFCSRSLVFDGTVEGKDNRADNTKEVADIRKCHFKWNCLQPGCYELWWWWWTQTLFILLTCSMN